MVWRAFYSDGVSIDRVQKKRLIPSGSDARCDTRNKIAGLRDCVVARSRLKIALFPLAAMPDRWLRCLVWARSAIRTAASESARASKLSRRRSAQAGRTYQGKDADDENNVQDDGHVDFRKVKK